MVVIWAEEIWEIWVVEASKPLLIRLCANEGDWRDRLLWVLAIRRCSVAMLGGERGA